MITTKIYTIFKYITIALIVVLGISSCETDLENVGGDLVDNGVFNTQKEDFNVLAYTKNIEKSRVDNISTASLSKLSMPLGVYNKPDFGLLKSDLIAQLNLPAGLDWGDDPQLDAVYLEIPYDATSDGKDSDGLPKFKLNNVFGDQDVSYQIKVSRLDTYLSRLDEIDPSKAKKYYSDKVYNVSDELAPFFNFKPNANDTIELFDKTLLTGTNIVTVKDTIKYKDAKPFIRIPLNKTFFENNFITGSAINFDDNESFHQTFKGIMIKVEGTDGSVMMLDLATAKVNLYLTNSDTEDKTENQVQADLNNDGEIDDAEVTTTYAVRKQKIVTFPLTGIKTNHFNRDYASANGFTQITSPNITVGEKKLYVQGAAGSVAVIDLFNGVDLAQLRARNLLINEANLTFYIDNENDNDVPNRLLLYKLDPNDTDNINENEQILDAITAPNFFNGFLQKDDDNPTKYKINITDYISEVLKKEDFTAPSKLGLKVFNGLDTPLSADDIKVKEYSWNPQGVVLYGNDYQDTDADYSKRIKLEIYYTELNN